jgi:hypothetical protein
MVSLVIHGHGIAGDREKSEDIAMGRYLRVETIGCNIKKSDTIIIFALQLEWCKICAQVKNQGMSAGNQPSAIMIER